MNKLKILYLEDSEYDAELVGRTLKSAAIDFCMKLVDSQAEYEDALKQYEPDVILADHSLFQFNSLEALKIFKSHNLHVPFILVTGTVSEEFAVNILHEGADDYLLKNNLLRLPNAINNALEKFRIDKERETYLENIIANETLFKEAEHMARFGSWQVDIETGKVKWSDEAFRLYGYLPGEIVPDNAILLHHVHPEDLTCVEKALDEAKSKLSTYNCEFRMFDRSGNVKYISTKMVVQRNKLEAPIRLVGFNQDITERKQAEGKLLQSIKEVAKLEKELVEQQLAHQRIMTELTIQAQEKEREELGKELHDNINQVLATVKIYLDLAAADESARPDLIKKSSENVNYAIEEIRKLSKSLVAPSLGDIGLVEALEELVDEINMTKKIKLELKNDAKKVKNIESSKALMLYRIVQEQINNILKYAKATAATITLKTKAKVIFLSITDNGVGFDPLKKAKGIGLKNITGRVQFYSGSLNIISAPGKGCCLEIDIPI